MIHGINPNISVDCVIFGFDLKQLNVLLVERVFQSNLSQKPLFKDHTLIGNHILEQEDLEDAARRILKELTGVEHIYLEQFAALAHPERLKKDKDQIWLQHIGHNPSNRVITVGYFGLMDVNSMEIRSTGNPESMARKVSWFPIDKLPVLAFDHADILNQAILSLRTRMRLSTIGYLLLPKKFSLSQLQTLFEVIHGIRLDKRNFRKKMGRLKYLIPLNEKQSNVSHKPAQLYMFSRDVYEMTKGDLFENII